jgi:hypothetical protein
VRVELETDVPDKILLIAPNQATYPLDVPKVKADDSSTAKPIVLKQFDALWVEITGKDWTGAVSAEANQVILKVRIPKPATAAPANAADSKSPKTTKIEVEITREVTAKPGDADLTILDKDGKQVGDRSRLQVTCVLCGEGGK